MASERRIGGPEAKNRGALLDAAEALMLDEGYAAVTSRRVAERAGLKPQLVHYYFRTMDDLFLAAFRRRTEQGLAAQSMILLAPNPLRALWTFLIENRDTALIMEKVVLDLGGGGLLEVVLDWGGGLLPEVLLEVEVVAAAWRHRCEYDFLMSALLIASGAHVPCCVSHHPSDQ